MKQPLLLSALPLLMLFAGSCAEPADPVEIFYIGTFAGEESEGLYLCSFDRQTGELTLLETVSDRESPNFQAIHPDGLTLYSISRSPFREGRDDHTLSAYRIGAEDGRLTLLNEQSVHGRGPAHVSVDPLGEFVYVANYAEGNVLIFPVNENGSLEPASDVVQHEGSSVHPRQQRAHAHAADPSPDGRFLYVSDLGMDRIVIYEVDRESGRLRPAETPWFESTPAAGPRHFTFHPSGRVAYSVEELSSTVAVLEADSRTGALRQIQRLEMLPDDFEGDNTGAEIQITPDGRFLYATNRGHDSLAIYAVDAGTGMLTPVGHEPTRGGHPRNFIIDRFGEYLFVANRDGNHVVVFRIDPSTGELEWTGHEIRVPLAVAVTQHILQ